MVTRLCASMRREDTALELCSLGVAAPEGGGKAAEEGPEAARDSARKALAALEADNDIAIAVEPAPGMCSHGAACIGGIHQDKQPAYNLICFLLMMLVLHSLGCCAHSSSHSHTVAGHCITACFILATIEATLATIWKFVSGALGCCSRCPFAHGIETPGRTLFAAPPVLLVLSVRGMVHAEEGAEADADDDDPRPRRWNHAVVVFTAIILVITALGFGIVDGCLCGP